MDKTDYRTSKIETQYELRKQIVRHKEHGLTNKAVSELIGVRPEYVSRIWCRYKRDSVAGIKPRKRGRKSERALKLSKIQQAEIRKIIIDKTPDQLKISACLWTRQAICELIKKKYKIEITLRSITNYLKHWGFTCQRPTKRAISQDGVRVAEFMEKDYPEIAKRAKAEKAVIYWGDETGVSNQENYVRGFAPKGRPPVLKVQVKHEKINMLSAITNQGKVRFMIFNDTMNQQKLIDFMRRMIKDIHEKVFLILDNLKVHHGKLVKAWLEEHRDRIELFFLPSYSPELNPDEYLNNALKQVVHSGIKPRTSAELNSKTQSFMRRLQQNSDRVKSFFGHKNVQYIKCAI